MPRRLRVLAVHGVGRHPIHGDWMERWENAIRGSATGVLPDLDIDIEFVTYDDLFDAEAITLSGTLEAVGKLLASGLWFGLGDILGARELPSRRPRGITERIRWTAGMVLQWVENSRIRTRSRSRLARAVRDTDPHVICAHSLGSLIAYDTFGRRENAGLLADRTFISLGSQIGNPFVRSQFAGRVEPLDCAYWYHLFNPHDDIFTAPLSVPGDHFEQIDCEFDIEGFADHDAAHYLSHPNMSQLVWPELLGSARFRRATRTERARVATGGNHPYRALLVGINEYPEPDSRLEGCLNDVFLMSSVLQEYGYQPDEIRTVLDNRATAQGIRDRLEWLLDGTRPGDLRVFYYSGHGAQITDYGADETVDRLDECLVPWDFDWSRERAVTDDWFYNLYSQLDYGALFFVILDCCHSGGMTRAGLARPRGISPPDDIRHRQLKWNPALRTWESRSLQSPNKALGKDYLGATRTRRKFARATDLRTLPNAKYNRARKTFQHHGPYLPVILQACQEDELAYEYRHGVSSYGTFTYTLAQQLRGAAARDTRLAGLLDGVTGALKNMGYDQTPQLVAPDAIKDTVVLTPAIH